MRRAALALAREVERRVPALATSKWWKEERHGVFIDYNQNAKDRTVAGAYSIRPTPDARVSAPLDWNEVADADPAEFTLVDDAEAFREHRRSARATSTRAPTRWRALLELSRRQERDGQGDAPWPPQYAKQPGEPPRVQPSKRAGRTAAATGATSTRRHAPTPKPAKRPSTRKAP